MMMLLVQQHNSDQSVWAGQLENGSLMREKVAKPNGKRFSTIVTYSFISTENWVSTI